MLTKEMLKERESLFLKPFDEESKLFMLALNKSVRYEIL